MPRYIINTDNLGRERSRRRYRGVKFGTVYIVVLMLILVGMLISVLSGK